MPENAEHHNDDAANENAAPVEEAAKKKIKVEKPDQSEKDDADILSEEREGFSDPLEFLSAELDLRTGDAALHQVEVDESWANHDLRG